MLRFPYFGAVGLSAGVAVLVYASAVYRLDAKREAAVRASAAREAEFRREQVERSQLAAERERLRSAEAAAPVAQAAAKDVTAESVRREALLTLARLKKEQRISLLPGGRGPGSGLFAGNNTPITPAFAQMFGLSPAQYGELHAEIERIRARVGELAAAASTIRRSESGGLIIEIREPPEADDLRAQTRSAFVRAIGEDGVKIYDELRTGGFGGVLSSVGLGSRIVTIERRGARYDYRDATTGNGPGSGTNTGMSNLDRRNLELRLGPFARLVPADF